MNDSLNKFLDALMDNLNWVLIFFIVIFALLLFAKIYTTVKENLTFSKTTRKIIQGIDDTEKIKNLTEQEIKKKYKKRKKTNAFKKLYKEYIFFGGTGVKFFTSLAVGYIVLFILLLIVSKEPTLSLCFALAWFDLFYIVIDKKNEKHRKKYIKGFSLALRTLTASVEAGNSFEEGISLISRRDSINKKIRDEFILVSNNLKSGKALDDALEEFWQRNSMFQEFSMFVIIMQFFATKGGAGLGKILVELEDTLSKKVENYSEIDTELGIHKTLMNGCIYAYFIVLLGVKIFMPTFFLDMAADSLGIVKALGSVALIVAATVFFKSMVRSAAEG